MPLINRTGIPDTTRFNYVLEYLPEAEAPLQVLPNAQLASDPSSVPPAPPLEVALEQQLGLRLEPAQAPREYIVIDAIERPEGSGIRDQGHLISDPWSGSRI
jgi:uncharacterized protein (TIGR03435 family)